MQAPTFAQSDCPSAKVSIYYVKEAEACPPSGYGANEACPKFTAIDNFLKHHNTASPKSQIPPQYFSLSEFHRNILIGYATSFRESNLPLSRRYSSFFLFEWDSAPPVTVELTRKHLGKERTRTWGDIERRWVYHENAMFLDPEEGTKWVLKFPGCASPYEIRTYVGTSNDETDSRSAVN